MIINLPRRLEAWVEKGLINAAQAEAVLKFEKADAAPWAMYGMAGIGVTTILTGIVSLIAGNWEYLGDAAKLIGYFLLQAVLGFAFLRTASKPGVWRESSLSLFAFGFLAGIGLIAQVFHLSGDGWRALTLWLVITLPAVLQAEGRLFSNAWVLVLIYTSWVWATSRQLQLPEGVRLSVAASIPMVLTGVGFLAERWIKLPHAFRVAIRTWGLASMILAGTITANVLWNFIDKNDYAKIVPYLAIPWSALIFATIASLLRGNQVSKALRISTAVLLLVWGVYVTMPFLINQTEVLSKIARQLVGAAGFIVVGALAAISAALGGFRKLYDLATLAIAGRLVCIYFEVFGTMASTGIGLIITGVFILGLARLWQKHRSRLAQWLEARQ